MWLPLVRPLLGTWPATQACALTGNQTGNSLVLRLVLNLLSYTSQGCLPRSEQTTFMVLQKLLFKHWTVSTYFLPLPLETNHQLQVVSTCEPTACVCLGIHILRIYVIHTYAYDV